MYRLQIRISTVVVIMLMMTAMYSNVNAQNYNQMFKEVEALKSKIKQMDNHDTTTRATALQKFQQRLSTLEQQVARLIKHNQEQQITADDFASLLNDIEYLKAENLLNNTQKNNNRQFVSLNPAIDWDHDEVSMNMVPSDKSEGAEKQFGDIEFSGFVDVQAGHQSHVSDKAEFGLGQAELDLTRELSEHTGAEVAIAYNNETGNFELGAAIIDIHFSTNEDESHLLANSTVDHSYIVAGQFDVPFGIDYNFYPSSDRKLVTAPVIVDLSHGGWNDFGVQVGLDMKYGNFVGYWVNGFESSAEVIDNAQTLALGVTTYEEVDTSPVDAFGTRIGITPIDWLEFGSSFALGLNASSQTEMMIGGGDIQMSVGDFHLKGEYIYHSANKSVAPQDVQGYYIQMTYNTSWGFLVGRYGAYQPQGYSSNSESSVGAGYVIDEGLEIRAEQVLNENSDKNKTLLQLVASF